MHLSSPRSRPGRLAALAVAALAALPLASATQAADFEAPAPLSTALPNAGVRRLITAFEAGDRSVGLNVVSFWAPGERPVYLITPLCCDQFHPLYDAEGRYICAPSGGIAGTGDGTCPLWARADIAPRRTRPQPPAHRQQPWPPEPAR